jgi:hypothetical protein
MATKPAPSSTGGFLQNHDDEGFLDALHLLIDTHKIKTAEDLVRYAEQAKESAAAEMLRQFAADGLPVKLAFDALSVHIRIVAHKRNNQYMQDCRGKKVGLVMPLPPQVLDAFVSLANVTVLLPDGHHLPPGLRGRQIQECKGARAGRNLAPQFEVIVFEVCRSDDGFLVDPAVSDIVDLRLIPASTKLLAHVRPHSNPDDIPFVIGNHTINLL